MLRKYLGTALVGGLAMLPMLATPASAATRDVDAVKRRCTVAVDVRIAALDRLDVRLHAAKQALAEYEAKVADASKNVTGIADTLLGYQPHDYNSNPQLLKPSRTSLHTAAADLRAARTDVHTIVTTLKGAK